MPAIAPPTPFARHGSPLRRRSSPPAVAPVALCSSASAASATILATFSLSKLHLLEAIGARQDGLRHRPSLTQLAGQTTRLARNASPAFRREYATVDQHRVAARLVGCDASTVRRAIRRGELDAYRLGRRGMYRIDVAALRDWARPVNELEESTR